MRRDPAGSIAGPSSSIVCAGCAVGAKLETSPCSGPKAPPPIFDRTQVCRASCSSPSGRDALPRLRPPVRGVLPERRSFLVGYAIPRTHLPRVMRRCPACSRPAPPSAKGAPGRVSPIESPRPAERLLQYCGSEPKPCTGDPSSVGAGLLALSMRSRVRSRAGVRAALRPAPSCPSSAATEITTTAPGHRRRIRLLPRFPGRGLALIHTGSVRGASLRPTLSFAPTCREAQPQAAGVAYVLPLLPCESPPRTGGQGRGTIPSDSRRGNCAPCTTMSGPGIAILGSRWCTPVYGCRSGRPLRRRTGRSFALLASAPSAPASASSKASCPCCRRRFVPAPCSPTPGPLPRAGPPRRHLARPAPAYLLSAGPPRRHSATAGPRSVGVICATRQDLEDAFRVPRRSRGCRSAYGRHFRAPTASIRSPCASDRLDGPLRA